MAKRLTPFIGLAVVAALVLAAAFGAFSLSPAYAGPEAPNARGLAQPVDFQAQSRTPLLAPVFVVENSAATTPRTDIVMGPSAPANMRMAVGDTVTIDLTTPIANAAGNTGTTQLDRAYIILPNATVVSLSAAEGVGTVNAANTEVGGVDITSTASSTEVTITAVAAGDVRVQVIGEDTDSTGVDNPATTDYSEIHSRYWFSIVVMANELDLSSQDPRANARYDLTFVSPANLVAGVGEITIELEDFNLPGSTLPGAVGISSDAYYNSENDTRQLFDNTVAAYNTDGSRIVPASSYQGGLIAPNDVTLSGDEITITVPDMNPENDRGDDIMRGDLINIVIRQGAGITNPSEGGSYPAKITNSARTAVTLTTDEEMVPRLVELSEEDGGRGTSVTATGKGFKNGTSLGFFLDADGDGTLDAGETRLCDVARVGGNDVGSCTFTVSNPPFDPGYNFVNAVDGRGQYATAADNNDQRFELKPSITATPSGGSPGDSILVQGTDFPNGGTLSSVLLARQTARDLFTAQGLSASVGANGDISFRLTVPDWAIEGIQDLQVKVTHSGGEADDNINITIGGPTVVATPTTVLANQRISLVGTGFSAGARITGDDTGVTRDPSIAIGGYVVPDELINDGDPVTVDNGGKWSASLDLPLRSVTTRDGEREIRITDSSGRSGTVTVTIPARVVSIDPPVGRIGTEATIRGENFPSRNNNGESFNIQISYDPGGGRETQESTVSDASGRFETQIRIPTGATIPSTNPVRVTFTDEQEIEVTTTVSHEVPEGSIALSATSGLPGSTITLSLEGFEAFVPVRSVKVGSIEVTPSPAPSTDALGQEDFEILIPGLDVGIQTIEVQVSDTTASVGFTIQSGAAIGAVTPVAEGVSDLGDNLVRVFYFDNGTKLWSFYDPMAPEASDLENFIAGNSYWIRVAATGDAILNRETRSLSCSADGSNCWNLITW